MTPQASRSWYIYKENRNNTKSRSVHIFICMQKQLHVSAIYSHHQSEHRTVSKIYPLPPLWRCGPTLARASSFLRFLDHTQWRTTVGRTPLDEWSARRRDLYLTTHNTHNRQISMSPVGIRTHDLSRRAAADLRLRPRGHWDRLSEIYNTTKLQSLLICNLRFYM